MIEPSPSDPSPTFPSPLPLPVSPSDPEPPSFVPLLGSSGSSGSTDGFGSVDGVGLVVVFSSSSVSFFVVVDPVLMVNVFYKF